MLVFDFRFLVYYYFYQMCYLNSEAAKERCPTKIVK